MNKSRKLEFMRILTRITIVGNPVESIILLRALIIPYFRGLLLFKKCKDFPKLVLGKNCSSRNTTFTAVNLKCALLLRCCLAPGTNYAQHMLTMRAEDGWKSGQGTQEVAERSRRSPDHE